MGMGKGSEVTREGTGGDTGGGEGTRGCAISWVVEEFGVEG
jgi:hypothetical protein